MRYLLIRIVSMDPTSAVEEFGLVPEDNYSIPVEGIATLVCITLGLFYWFYYNVKDNSFPSPSSSNTNAASFREKRFASFVEHEISSYEMVLFVTKEDCATSYHALFDALQAPGHIVNLAQTACGSRVLEVLRESYSKEVSDIYLFVKGQLVGGTKEIQTFIVEGQKNEVGRNWDWGHIRIDPKMDTGFMILDEFNSFQCVNDVGNDKETIVKLETRPLVSVQELCTFNPANLVQCHIPIALHVRNQRRRSKLLVCHDMKGGYLGDRFKQGCNDFDAYRFYQWDLVDVFVYFGHALVCPPPCGWIAAGHRHGTRVLGTFLTEGEDGTERCKELFQNAQTAEAFAFKLAAIAWHGGFEGWLINIENDVPSDLIAHLKTFLHTLHNKLQLQNPLAQIVWYGSLSSLGKRSSYVRLDKCSTDFFQHVDGFYADYGWRSEDAKFSAAFDLDRRYDVYMGIDVFGRHNMLGGGKMNCSEPLRVVWNAGVSAALFAPGWSYECYQFEENEEFVVAEHRFWSAIRESWKVKSPCYDSLGGQNCFYTAFNVGRGNGVWLDGTCVGSSTWFNMTEMDVQPDHILHVGKVNVTATGSMKAVISHALAFQGGASVQLQGQLESKEKSYFKLYDVDIEFSSRRFIEISYTTATQDDSVCLLVLTVCPGLDRATHVIILRSMDIPGMSKRHLNNNKTLSTVAKALSKKHFYLPFCTEYFDAVGADADAVQELTKGWCKKTYRLGGQLWEKKHIVEIGILCTKKNNSLEGPRDFLAYLGEICMVSSCGKIAVHCGVHTQPKSCKNAMVTSFLRNSSRTISFELHWTFTSDGAPVRYVVVFACTGSGKRIYVGKSFDNTLWVESWDLQTGEKANDASIFLTLELQSVSWAGQSSTNICRLHLEE